MHFYIDESGHTGGNLFDLTQPIFYYGILSSPMNLDVMGASDLERIKELLGVNTVHSKEIGATKLEIAADAILLMQEKYEIRFDLVRIVKRDHAIISFFDQVFDSGVNSAVPWEFYNTPAKYALLFELAKLFDDELAKLAWSARIEVDETSSAAKLDELIGRLIERIHSIANLSAREITRRALVWARANSSKLSYSVTGIEGVKDISPNMILFASVLERISDQLIDGRNAVAIVVDQQQEFNEHQHSLRDLFYKIKDVEMFERPDMPNLRIENIPDLPLSVTSSDISVGLQLVDIFLWSARRLTEGRVIGPKLARLLDKTEGRDGIFEVSLDMLKIKWAPYFAGKLGVR